VVPCLGLTGFWLPVFLSWARSETAGALFRQLLYAGTLASFCIAVLAEGLAGLLLAEKSGSTTTAAGIRGIVGAWVIGLIIVLVGTMGVETSTTVASPSHVTVWVHLLLGILAVSTGAYLYCFRSSPWEERVKSVEEAKAEEDRQVNKLAETAAHQSAEGDVRL
jgi:hypothetical protein